tara:strand:- start:747 stop:1256 length:510 start_codon:yes stop_codon:yes gene_type:complete
MALLDKKNKAIISFISNKYKIPINTLKLEITEVLNNMSNDVKYNKSKCDAYIMLNGNKVQCSRSKKIGDFCKTHHRQNEENKLKYGKFNQNGISSIKCNDCINNNNDNDNNNESDNIKKYKKPILLEYITIKEMDYYFNPITKYIYDFDTKKKVGKLDNDLNIIKKYKN